MSVDRQEDVGVDAAVPRTRSWRRPGYRRSGRADGGHWPECRPHTTLYCDVPIGPSNSVSMVSEKPMMAFSGVRSSWLILARNSVLLRLAASASRTATSSCASRSFSWVDVLIDRHRAALGGRAPADAATMSRHPGWFPDSAISSPELLAGRIGNLFQIDLIDRTVACGRPARESLSLLTASLPSGS